MTSSNIKPTEKLSCSWLVNEVSQAKIFFLVDNQKSFPPTSDSGRIVLSHLSLHLGLSSGLLRLLLFWSIVFFHFISTCQKNHKNMANGFNCLCIFCNVNKNINFKYLGQFLNILIKFFVKAGFIINMMKENS